MRIVEQYGSRVRSGPFAGMKYPQNVLGRAPIVGAKLLGSYEQELAPTIQALLGERFQTILNIGVGEGYYAVGFALRCRDAQVRAYEIDGRQRRLCAQVASANGVAERVTIEGACDLERLRDDTLGRVLILCDCEGCELDLLRPDRHPLLRKATLIVELHNWEEPASTDQMLSRFSRSHDTEVIVMEHRDPARYSELAGMSEMEAGLVLWERDEGSWAVLRPRIDLTEEGSSEVHSTGGPTA